MLLVAILWNSLALTSNIVTDVAITMKCEGEERAPLGPARIYRRYTGLNLNSTKPPLT